MATDADFLAAIRASDDPDTERLVYADWLQEQGRDSEAASARSLGVPAALDAYDWMQAFGPAGGEPDADGNVRGTPEAARPDSPVPLSPFGRRDVRRVLAVQEGEHDGPDWVCVGELWDGRFFALRAGCDYSGWD